jgi:hypothetical protein
VPVITEAYRAQQQELHKRPDYGVASLHFAKFVKMVIDHFGLKSVSDYGAGKRHLRTTLAELGANVAYTAYDPAFPEYGEPKPADLVCCIDVLEHIEPECLDTVLDDLQRITTNVGFYTVHTTPAEKILPDGRNAHLILEPPEWWLPKIEARWDLEGPPRVFDGGFLVVVKAKTAP